MRSLSWRHTRELNSRARHRPIHSRCSRLLKHVGDCTFTEGARSIWLHFFEPAQQPRSINVEDVHMWPLGSVAAGKPSSLIQRHRVRSDRPNSLAIAATPITMPPVPIGDL